MSRFILVIIVSALSSCCKDTEIIKQLENKDYIFSIYSTLYMENVTIHKNNNKLKRIVFNNKSYYDNSEYFSNDSNQSVWSRGLKNDIRFQFKSIKTKDTLMHITSLDTTLYIFESNILRKIKMPYNDYLYVINSYNSNKIDMTLVAGVNQIKRADYIIELDTASYQDFYPQSYYTFLPPLNYLRYYTEFYNLDFPKLSYKSISIKTNSILISSEEISIKNEFDSINRLKRSFIIRKNYPISNDTLTFTYFD